MTSILQSIKTTSGAHAHIGASASSVIVTPSATQYAIVTVITNGTVSANFGGTNTQISGADPVVNLYVGPGITLTIATSAASAAEWNYALFGNTG